MHIVKSLTLISALTLSAGTVWAQTSPGEMPQSDKTLTEPAVKSAPIISGHDMFRSADTDADQTLNREEFVSFALMKASAGDSYFSMIREKGAYETAFNTHDGNADGQLSETELDPKLGSDKADKMLGKPMDRLDKSSMSDKKATPEPKSKSMKSEGESDPE